VELSAGYQPRVNGGDGAGLGDGVAVGNVVGDGVAAGVGADVGEPVGDGLSVGVWLAAVDVADGVAMGDGNGLAGADTVAAGGAPARDPLNGPASAFPPTTAEATVRAVPVLITTHFSTRM
jgi:hypothetical protein